MKRDSAADTQARKRLPDTRLDPPAGIFPRFPRMYIAHGSLASRPREPSDEEILYEARFIAPLSYDASSTFVSGAFYSPKRKKKEKKEEPLLLYYNFPNFFTSFIFSYPDLFLA